MLLAGGGGVDGGFVVFRLFLECYVDNLFLNVGWFFGFYVGNYHLF